MLVDPPSAIDRGHLSNNPESRVMCIYYFARLCLRNTSSSSSLPISVFLRKKFILPKLSLSSLMISFALDEHLVGIELNWTIVVNWEEEEKKKKLYSFVRRKSAPLRPWLAYNNQQSSGTELSFFFFFFIPASSPSFHHGVSLLLFFRVCSPLFLSRPFSSFVWRRLPSSSRRCRSQMLLTWRVFFFKIATCRNSNLRAAHSISSCSFFSFFFWFNFILPFLSYLRLLIEVFFDGISVCTFSKSRPYWFPTGSLSLACDILISCSTNCVAIGIKRRGVR